MESAAAIKSLAALAQATRLDAFRILVREGPEGLAAGVLAARLGVQPATLSFHLAQLERAGLLVSHRGTQGGYSLDRPPEEVTVADAISALEGPIALTECAGETDSSCDIELSCPVRTNWQRITDAVRDALEAIPLTEMTPSFPLHHPSPPNLETNGTALLGEQDR